jgi:polyvinyl alcohol dehydrogenase (cytochrome)
VHALDARTGCTRWTFQAASDVRPAIVLAPVGEAGKGYGLLFGDREGWFYALDAETGRQLWKKKIDDHAAARVTGAAVAHDGVVYIPVASAEETLARREGYACCTFRGSVAALRIADGSQIWKTYMIAEAARKTGTNAKGIEEWSPSGAGVWSAPTADLKRGLLYVA